MKTCTDIDKSKVLAEILPPESADMHYVRKTHDFRGNPVNSEWSYPKYGNPNSKHANYIVQNFTSYEKIPCWSLAALLDYLKQRYYVRLSHDGVSWGITCFEHDTKKEYNLYMFDEPVDACWGMVLRLNKKGLL